MSKKNSPLTPQEEADYQRCMQVIETSLAKIVRDCSKLTDAEFAFVMREWERKYAAESQDHQIASVFRCAIENRRDAWKERN